MTNTQIVKELIALAPELNIFRIEEVEIKGKTVKVIHVSNSRTRVRCTYCGKYSRNIHSQLKPIKIKYLDIAGYTTYLMVYIKNAEKYSLKITTLTGQRRHCL